jgi:mevalonate kinase
VGLGCAGHLLPAVKASAPGKIILFGEHAVVYNRPALAVPVTQVHADVEVSGSSRPGIWVNAPGIGLHAEINSLPPDHPVGSVVLKVFSTLGISNPPSLEIDISSTIPVASGLGSGAAVSVALIRALAEHAAYPLTNEQVNQISFEIEKLHHGTPSGIDNTVITYNKPVYFIKGQPIETFNVAKPFTVVIGDTGIPAPTKESVGDVRRLWLSNSVKFENFFDQISQITLKARHHLEVGNPDLLGGLMDQNHAILQNMSVSSPELDELVNAARDAGAQGAKLSGGGRGGNMIALVEQAKAQLVASSLISAGAKGTIITEVS